MKPIKPLRRAFSAASVIALAVVAAAFLPTSAPGSTAQQSSFLGPAEGETLEAWSARWLDGPVKHIATDEERDIYRSLEGTQERLQFIRLFWQRRDPRVRGPVNEFLQEFEARLAYANEEFGNGQPGWETVFGQVVLVLGIPDRTRRELGLPPGYSDRPPIVWGYDRRIPEWPPNEDLLFVFRDGRWRLMPPVESTGGVDARINEFERGTNIAVMPTVMLQAMQLAVEETLVRPVDYRDAIDRVRAAVAFPDAQIPFGWEAGFSAGQGETTAIDLSLSWRMGSLIFHVVEGTYQTEMVLRATLVTEEGVVAADTTEHISVQVGLEELDERGDEIVDRSVRLEAPPGEYTLELTLEDQLLGYRTLYREPFEVPSR